MKWTQGSKTFLLAAALALPLVGTSVTATRAHAQPAPTSTQYIKACAATDPASVCNNTSLVGLDVDRVTNVIYAVDGNNERLVRIDGSTNRTVDSFNLPNCNDPRRPAITHITGFTKIYIGCEGQRDILVLRVNGRLGAITQVARIPLTIPGASDAFEPKTERINDANQQGKVFVVGDENSSSSGSLSCSDPAFVISSYTDTIISSNAILGTPSQSDCNTSATGINDVAIGATNIFWMNEDDHKIYSTDALLHSNGVSAPLRNDCFEDAPKFGDVIGSRVFATAPEAGAPCFTETGLLYTLNSTSLIGTQAPSGFSAGRVAAAGFNFLVADMSISSGLPNCAVSCVNTYTLNGVLIRTTPLVYSQNDVVFNGMTNKAYLSLDENSLGADVAVVSNP